MASGDGSRTQCSHFASLLAHFLSRMRHDTSAHMSMWAATPCSVAVDPPGSGTGLCSPASGSSSLLSAARISGSRDPCCSSSYQVQGIAKEGTLVTRIPDPQHLKQTWNIQTRIQKPAQTCSSMASRDGTTDGCCTPDMVPWTSTPDAMPHPDASPVFFL